jgi:hypothetical protein
MITCLTLCCHHHFATYLTCCTSHDDTVLSFCIRGDAEALSKTEKFLASGQIMREESLRLASTMCQPLENTLCEEDYYRVESTGAIVTINSSVPLINFFCSKLPFDESVFVSITNGFHLLHTAKTVFRHRYYMFLMELFSVCQIL